MNEEFAPVVEDEVDGEFLRAFGEGAVTPGWPSFYHLDGVLEVQQVGDLYVDYDLWCGAEMLDVLFMDLFLGNVRGSARR